jgi:mevalonate kinase
MGWGALSLPSKAFILGEYAVLKGAPALVATLAPRFELRESGEGKKFSEISPEAPVRLLLSNAGQEGSALLDASFLDPHKGSGGFGGSTAEFALAYGALHGTSTPVTKMWSEYCRIQPKASGADLAAQWSGGAVIADPVMKTVEKIAAEKLLSRWFVFSAAHQPGRKVKTHEHLDALARADLSHLAKSEVLHNGLQAARTGQFEAFARAVNEYAMLLRSMGFELPQTTEDRMALRDVRGVCAVKGTGAMQADAILVLGDPALGLEEIAEQLLPVAGKRDLRLVASGWKEERGVHG